MDYKIELFIELADIFEKNGFQLYLVGGSVRDYLLNIPLTDMDVVTNATPDDMKFFLLDADFTFERFGSVKYKFKNEKFDITTLRKESEYVDSRHPNKITYTDKLIEDVYRRDITINALYLSKDLKVIDYISGLNDLKNKLIRLIGNPNKRIVEDPLRIYRLLRFKVDLGFDIEENTLNSLKKNKFCVEKLNVEKIRQEINKCHNKELLLEEFEKL